MFPCNTLRQTVINLVPTIMLVFCYSLSSIPVLLFFHQSYCIYHSISIHDSTFPVELAVYRCVWAVAVSHIDTHTRSLSSPRFYCMYLYFCPSVALIAEGHPWCAPRVATYDIPWRSVSCESPLYQVITSQLWVPIIPGHSLPVVSPHHTRS